MPVCRVWDLAYEDEGEEPQEEIVFVWSTSLSPCGNFLATGTEDGHVR